MVPGFKCLDSSSYLCLVLHNNQWNSPWGGPQTWCRPRTIPLPSYLPHCNREASGTTTGITDRVKTEKEWLKNKIHPFKARSCQTVSFLFMMAPVERRTFTDEREGSWWQTKTKKKIYNGNKSGMTHWILYSWRHSWWKKTLKKEASFSVCVWWLLLCCEPTGRAITSLQQNIPPTFGSV